MSTGWIVLIVVLVILAAIVVALIILGKKAQKRQAEQQVQLDAMKQTVTMLIIDKKKLPLKSSGLPQQAIDQTPWYAKRSKVPIVKAKVGPRIMNLIADNDVFDVLPVKAEVKVEISGMYITAVKSVRGASLQKPEKKSWWQRTRGK
jgi:type II secretory pathway pseudopilin PulG